MTSLHGARVGVFLAFGIAFGPAAEPASHQDRKPPPPWWANRVDEVKVSDAIRKGISWLRANKGQDEQDVELCTDEFVLWTLVDVGISPEDPLFKPLLKKMLERELKWTYRVSLQAMVLEAVDRVRYQWRVAQCAQFLVDNQSARGGWGYGEPTPFVTQFPAPPETATPAKANARRPGRSEAGPGAKPRVVRRIPVKKRRDGKDGDNSNSQYAALGLRAAHEAGIDLPPEVVTRALEWWRRAQAKALEPKPARVELKADPRAKPGQVITAEPHGWCYGGDASGRGHDIGYGSMTAGAVGSLAIWLYIKDNDGGRRRSWLADEDIHEGLAWLTRKFSVAFNPGTDHNGNVDSPASYYYYLYAVERMGALYGTETLGDHEWYPEGAKALLERQEADGSWSNTGRNRTVKTCFALLFLRRGTTPLADVASVDRFKPR